MEINCGSNLTSPINLRIMKEFLLSTTIPYWIVFGLVTAAGVLALINMRKNTVSKSSVQLVTLLALAGTVLGLAIYSVAGGSSIWWCTSKDYSFFGKLLRAIPLIIFVGIQLAQVFVYKTFVEQYFQKELSIKGSFISLIVIVPASFVLYIILDILGLEKGTRDLIFYIILGIALVAGVGWAMALNVKSIGKKYGSIFTAVTLVMIIGGLMSIVLLINALMALILQVLMVAAVVVAGFYMFTKVMGPAVDTQSRTDLSGKVHDTQWEKQNADARIRSQRDNK
jgi:hypothetical protein